MFDFLKKIFSKKQEEDTVADQSNAPENPEPMKSPFEIESSSDSNPDNFEKN